MKIEDLDEMRRILSMPNATVPNLIARVTEMVASNKRKHDSTNNIYTREQCRVTHMRFEAIIAGLQLLAPKE